MSWNAKTVMDPAQEATQAYDGRREVRQWPKQPSALTHHANAWSKKADPTGNTAANTARRKVSRSSCGVSAATRPVIRHGGRQTREIVVRARDGAHPHEGRGGGNR